MSIINSLKKFADLLYSVHGHGLFCITPMANRDTLPLKRAFLQGNSWACGASAAATIICYFRPARKPGLIYDRIAPDPENGTPLSRVVAEVRNCGIHMIRMRRGGGLPGIRYQLSRRRPVLALWKAYTEDCEHYVVVYGEHNGVLYMANIADNWLDEFQISYAKFKMNGGYVAYAADYKPGGGR